MSPRIDREVAHGLDDVAGAGLALRADHGRALADAAQRLAEVGGAAHERHGEGPLVDVVGLVGRRQHLGLVDVVDAERLEHLGLDEVADAGLGHDRDRDGGLDALDHLRVAHAGDAAVAADVGRHPLEGHDRHRAGVLGDLGLLGVDDVHDDAALEHLGQAPLDAGRCRCRGASGMDRESTSASRRATDAYRDRIGGTFAAPPAIERPSRCVPGVSPIGWPAASVKAVTARRRRASAHGPSTTWPFGEHPRLAAADQLGLGHGGAAGVAERRCRRTRTNWMTTFAGADLHAGGVGVRRALLEPGVAAGRPTRSRPAPSPAPPSE